MKCKLGILKDVRKDDKNNIVGVKIIFLENLDTNRRRTEPI
jgi:hypothetical protein